ncbi:hypothetical protein [Streptomyces sp. I05A-00742]|uniref:hypothetical protein n=1 Tax=Streptomyces sp. I05A-00742 TaxID=2732853 RepID=UPI00148833FA|nr:hypothetical protein [Streptomyces sp. I05A-00742]
MDVLDWHRGTLSSRRLTVLVKHLPRDSAVNRDLHGEATDWGPAEHLLAAAVDHLAVANWMTATLHSDEDTEPLEYPEPVPRPGSNTLDTEERPEEAPSYMSGDIADKDRLAAFFA